MLEVLRPAAGRLATGGREASELGRAEIAARLAMASVAEDPLTFRPRALASPYGYCSAGLMAACAVIGAVFLFGPL
jgi:hypothetical protein